MAFLDSTGELSEEARALFMEAMVEEEDSEEEDEVKCCYLELFNFRLGQLWLGQFWLSQFLLGSVLGSVQGWNGTLNWYLIYLKGEPVNDGDGNTDIGNGDITDNNNGEQVQYSMIA